MQVFDTSFQKVIFIKAFDKEHAVVFIPLLEFKNIDLQHLRAFCVNVTTKFSSSRPIFRKLVCLYDYLAYGVDG
ncbi:hypothetical protein DN068_11970 [Taibaiella soli]|uniref:Uncharacterized protein n=1 Tax=Taibaiella soli TaxID=1649169 RepID=A0A2W2AB05_9BACT|nr:hypothetical protein DN068_11970 [Taibaiella soli]